ncbi:MAG TPA: sulfite exporter TauE/SafE family protein, partial [Phycisphaerales bacterium]|nr:sulfite exporter TauE/SafE family protein [Phycisphaerales bacterium]
MFDQTLLLVAGAVLCMAALYSTVGHGGGSGYLAVLAIAGVAPEEMRPTALVLNIVVASIATWRFSTTGIFRRALFVP